MAIENCTARDNCCSQSIGKKDSGHKNSTNPWIILALIMPIYFLTMFFRLAPSIMAPVLAKDFGMPLGEMALLSGVTFIAYGLMSLPSGLLADTIGCRKTVFVITLICGVGNIWFAMSSTYISALFARFLIGLGCALCVPGLAMLAVYFPKEHFAKISSIYLAGGTIGTVFSGIPLAYATEIFGWRMVMAAGGAICLICAFAVLFFVHESLPKKISSLKALMKELVLGLVKVLRKATFFPLCAWYCLLVGVYTSVCGLWWAPYLINGCGLSTSEAGQVMSVAYMFTIIGQPLMAFISDYCHSRKIVLIGSTVIALASVVTLCLFGHQLSVVGLTIQGVLFATCCGMVAVVAFSSAREMFPVDLAGSAIGCLQTLPFLVMGPLFQKGVALLLEWRSSVHPENLAAAYSESYFLHAVILLLALLLAFFIKETFGQKKA